MARLAADGAFEVVAQVSQPSKGVSKGALVDLNEATDAVSKTMAKLRGKTGRRHGDIYVNISGQTVKGSKSVGMIPIALRGREIARPDMDRCIGVASTIHLPFDREIIHKIVHRFSVDDQPWIKNPLGLYASRLSCEALIITADVNHIQSISKCVNNAGYDVKELVYTGIADGAGLLDAAQKEEGVALIDIGDTLTEVSIFSDGVLGDIEIAPLGSKDLKGDFRESAEFNGMVSRIASRIQGFVRSGGTVGSVMITGGMAFADGIIEYLESKLPYPIKMGAVKDMRGEISGIDSIRLSTAVGLAKYGYEKYEEKFRDGRTAAHRLSNMVVDIFNRYF